MLWGQLCQSNENGDGPVNMGHLMGSTWHIPNNEIVIITISYSETMSKLVIRHL